MITTRQAIGISRLIDKLDLKITDPSADAEKIGSDMIMQVVTKIHTAEDAVYELVASIKGCTKEEAKDVDLFELYQQKLADSELMRFFIKAARSKLQES